MYKHFKHLLYGTAWYCLEKTNIMHSQQLTNTSSNKFANIHFVYHIIYVLLMFCFWVSTIIHNTLLNQKSSCEIHQSKPGHRLHNVRRQQISTADRFTLRTTWPLRSTFLIGNPFVNHITKDIQWNRSVFQHGVVKLANVELVTCRIETICYLQVCNYALFCCHYAKETHTMDSYHLTFSHCDCIVCSHANIIFLNGLNGKSKFRQGYNNKYVDKHHLVVNESSIDKKRVVRKMQYIYEIIQLRMTTHCRSSVARNLSLG